MQLWISTCCLPCSFSIRPFNSIDTIPFATRNKTRRGGGELYYCIVGCIVVNSLLFLLFFHRIHFDSYQHHSGVGRTIEGVMTPWRRRGVWIKCELIKKVRGRGRKWSCYFLYFSFSLFRSIHIRLWEGINMPLLSSHSYATQFN